MLLLSDCQKLLYQDRMGRERPVCRSFVCCGKCLKNTVFFNPAYIFRFYCPGFWNDT